MCPGSPTAFSLPALFEHVQHAGQHHRIALHVDAGKVRGRGHHGLRDRGRAVGLPVGRLLDHLDVGKALLHAGIEPAGAVAAVGRGLVAHHREHRALAAERLAHLLAGVGAHADVVGAHDHRGLAAGRADVDRDHGHVLLGGVGERRHDRVAVGRHHDDALGALRDQVAEIGDLLAGVAVGVGHRQGLETRLLGFGHGQVDLDRLERIGQEADRIAEGEALRLRRAGAHRDRDSERQPRRVTALSAHQVISLCFVFRPTRIGDHGRHRDCSPSARARRGEGVDIPATVLRRGLAAIARGSAAGGNAPRSGRVPPRARRSGTRCPGTARRSHGWRGCQSLAPLVS